MSPKIPNTSQHEKVVLLGAAQVPKSASHVMTERSHKETHTADMQTLREPKY